MSVAAVSEWQFWIDVGGTFTDCVARRPDGSLATHKLLSSGVYKGVVGSGSTVRMICDPSRSSDPPRFFDGFNLTLLPRTNGDASVHLAPLDRDVPVVR